MKKLDLELLQRLSILDKDVPFYKKLIKLQEEVGELSQEFLAYDDKQLGIRTNSSKSAKGTLETVIEETCDVINVAIDLLNAIEMSQEYKDRLPSDYIENEFHRKLLKWHSKVQSKDEMKA